MDHRVIRDLLDVMVTLDQLELAVLLVNLAHPEKVDQLEYLDLQDLKENVV